jgi:hypothetical protein
MEKREVYRLEDNGELTLILSEEVQAPEVSTEDLIKQKEEQLLEMYKELEALKQQNS